MNDLFDDHIGDALHRAAAGVPGHAPGFGDVRRRVRHRRRVHTGLAAVPVVAAGGLLALRHSPVAVPLTPGALGTAGEGMPTTSPLSDCYVVETTVLSSDWTGMLPVETTVTAPLTGPSPEPGDPTSSIGGAARPEVGDTTSSYPGATSTTITAVVVNGEPTDTTLPAYSATPTTSYGPSAMPSTIPCDGTTPVTMENGLPTTTMQPICDQPATVPPCLEVPTSEPTVWESGLTINGVVFRLTSDPSGNSGGICQWYHDTMSGCDGDLLGDGQILSILRSSDSNQGLVFGVARPGVRVALGLPDGSVLDATMGDGDWRIAWAIAIPAELTDIVDQGGVVLRLYPAGAEPSSDLTPDTMLVDAPPFDEMSVLDLGDSASGGPGSTTTSLPGG